MKEYHVQLKIYNCVNYTYSNIYNDNYVNKESFNEISPIGEAPSCCQIHVIQNRISLTTNTL